MNIKHLKSIAIAYIFIFVIFLSGCGGTSSSKVLSQGSSYAYDEYSVGKIKGTITAADTGLGLPGAIVEAYQCQATTGNDGTFLLEGIPAGDHSVTVRLQGYNAVSKTDVRVYTGKVTENINFALSYATNQYSSDFQVLSLNPNWGTDGDTVTILCSSCGRSAGRVTFNGVDAQVIDWNSTNDGRIRVTLPNNVETGQVKVIINGETSKELNAVNFIAKPVILGVHPDIASGGQTIVVNGRNFSPIYSQNKFQLNGVDCHTLEDDASIYNVKVVLPADARTGNLTVKLINVGQYAVEGVGTAVVTVAPKLVHISPMRSVPGVPITLYGYNFGTNMSIFKILVGNYEVSPSDITSLTDTSVTFNAPSNSIIAAGSTVEVRVQVNNAVSNSLNYTAYNNVDTSITDYGIYDLSSVLRGNKLKIAKLKPTDVIAFVSTLSGPNTQTFNEEYYYYVVSAYLGGNTVVVPTLPTSVRASEYASRFTSQSILGTSFSNFTAPVEKPSASIRASMVEPASETISVFVRDFTKPSPYDAANDIEQTGIIGASSTHALVYLEESLATFTRETCVGIAKEFDKTYDSIKTRFGVLTPPEGNIDAQERIVIFLTDKVDNKPDKAAYFDPRDKNTQQVNTNGTEIIFASPNKYGSDPNEFHAELCYALHQMFYYNQRWDPAKVAYYGTDWQSAGLSMMARQESGRGFSNGNPMDVQRVKYYLSNPEKARLDSWPETLTDGNYGMQFLFAQYLCDRCGGDNTIKMLESGQISNVKRGLEDIEMNILPEANPSCGGLSDFFNDFCLAMYCDNLGLPNSFSGYNENKYKFDSLNLRAGGVTGLRGKSLSENPVNKVAYQIPGFGCSVLAYNGGNWGDLEFEIISKPDAGIFKTWVIYYSTEQLQ